MPKIVEFDPTKRELQEQFDAFKKLLEAVKPEELTELMVYVRTKDDKVQLRCYAPSYEMVGRLKMFLTEINLELYYADFIDQDEEDT